MGLSTRTKRAQNLQLLAGLGDMGDIELVRVTGKNPIIADSSTFEDIWGYNSDHDDFAAPGLIDVVSSSANDASIWADKVTVYGLDANGDRISEEISLNGITPVTSTNEFSFVYKQEITAWNAVKENAGSITVNEAGGTTKYFSRMEAGDNRTHDCFYQIPRGYVGLVLDTWAAIGRSQPTGEADILVCVRRQDSVLDTSRGYIYEFPYSIEAGSGTTYIPLTQPIYLNQHDRVKMMANAGDTSTVLFGGMTIALIRQ